MPGESGKNEAKQVDRGQSLRGREGLDLGFREISQL